MERYEYTLPLEQWRQVLVNVRTKDLCNVALTSRHMNSVASLPEMWAGMKVNKRKVGENGLAELYDINRFKKVKEINLSKWELESEELERLLKEIPGTPLQNANLRRTNLSGLSSELLASAVSHLHIVNLGSTYLTTDQCIAIVKASLTSTTLTKVNLDCVNLSKVPAEHLANSISRLQDVSMRATSLTTDQCVALLKANLCSTTLRTVDLTSVSLIGVPAELLGNSISQLQNINLGLTRLTIDQCVALLKANLTSTTLRNVNLDGVDLSKVPAELLANSISRLQDVNLHATSQTTDQCVALLKENLCSTTLRTVDLTYVSLSGIPAELLGNSISRLQDVNLHATSLTTDQCVALLKENLCSTALRKVNLTSVNLSGVPAELLANSISRLQDVNLHATSLTTDQCVAFLKENLCSTTLRTVDLTYVSLSGVPAELLGNSISRLQDVNLHATSLTTDQCVALLKANLCSTTLRKVNLTSVNLSGVPAELLANSISRLQNVNLCRTGLTTVQCVALLKAIRCSTTLHHINVEGNQNTQKLPADQQHLLASLAGHVRAQFSTRAALHTRAARMSAPTK